jgi:hypothetical protein
MLHGIHELDRGQFQGVTSKIQICGVGIRRALRSGLHDGLECSELQGIRSPTNE